MIKRGKKIFITGTGTGVGKTMVSAVLAQGLAQLEYRVSYWKPVQTGLDSNSPSDSAWVSQQVDERKITLINSTFEYCLPASPDQAAAAEQRAAPTISELKHMLEAIDDEFVIVEGAGGLLVPLNETPETWVDFVCATDLPLIVVADSGLGTLNHTSLTLRCAETNGIEVLGVVLSGPQHAANEASLLRLHPKLPLFSLPRIEHYAKNPAWPDLGFALAEFVTDRTNRMNQPLDWPAADSKYCWHPYTQHQTAPAPLAIKKAKGIWFYTVDGQKLIDGCSSWWVNTIGHGRREIAQSIASQQARLDHVIFAGVTHEPAVTLAERLITLTGNKLSRVFYSDNGSTAVEVALKIAYQSWANRGDAQRTKFLAFSGSYHGDTFGAMSIGASDGFHSVFDPFRFTTLWVDPVTSHPSIVCPEGAIALEKKIATLDALLAAEHTKLAGVIVEPLVQGAAGMLMQPIQFLKELERLCHKYSLPLIFDEVFTGFGRVGAMFAFQRAGVGPDIVCLAKGLTGGNLPLAVTLAQEQYFEHFLADDKSKALLHGHSYTANAISCRSALTTLDILDRENIIERTLELETAFTSWINTEENRLKLENPRALGGILAFELPHSGLGNYFHEKAAQIPKIAKKYGLFLRPLGNTVYFLPPLVISNAECKFALDALSSVVKELSHDFP